MEGARIKNYFKYNFLFYFLVFLVLSGNSVYLIYKGVEEKQRKESLLTERVEKYIDKAVEDLRKNSERYQEYQLIDRGEFGYLLKTVKGRWKVYNNWEGRWSDIDINGESYFLEKSSGGTLLMEGKYYIYGGSIKGNMGTYSMWEIDQKFLDTLEEETGIEAGISPERGINYLMPVVNSAEGLTLYLEYEERPALEVFLIGGYFLLLITISLMHMRGVKMKVEEEEERVVEEVETIKNNKKDTSPIDRSSIFFNINMAIRELGEKYLKKTEELNQLRRRLTHTNLQLRKVAIVDRLTGLYNKMFLYEVLGDLKKNRAGLPYYSVVMMVDLDNFKRLNDSYGHLAGDRLLREVGDFLKKICSEKGLAFRYGGDEFFIVFKKIRYEDFLELMSYFEEEKEEIIRNYLQVKLGMSTGAIILKDEVEYDVDKIIKEVDELLYEAKKKGKNQVVFKI